MLAVTHGIAQFVDAPAGRDDVDLVAHEWNRSPQRSEEEPPPKSGST
jgi:hypothetical protein